MCRPKHVEQLRNTGIINSTTQLHLLVTFYETDICRLGKYVNFFLILVVVLWISSRILHAQPILSRIPHAQLISSRILHAQPISSRILHAQPILSRIPHAQLISSRILHAQPISSRILHA